MSCNEKRSLLDICRLQRIRSVCLSAYFVVIGIYWLLRQKKRNSCVSGLITDHEFELFTLNFLWGGILGSNNQLSPVLTRSVWPF